VSCLTSRAKSASAPQYRKLNKSTRRTKRTSDRTGRRRIIQMLSLQEYGDTSSRCTRRKPTPSFQGRPETWRLSLYKRRSSGRRRSDPRRRLRRRDAPSLMKSTWVNRAGRAEEPGGQSSTHHEARYPAVRLTILKTCAVGRATKPRERIAGRLKMRLRTGTLIAACWGGFCQGVDY